MRSTAFVIIFGSILSNHAFAGDYEEALHIDSQCNYFGRVGAATFSERDLDKPRMKPSIERHGMLYPLMKFAIDFGYNKAASEEEAFKVSYGKCLDNYRWLVRRTQNNEPIPETLLY